jgi:hypothetical protein
MNCTCGDENPTATLAPAAPTLTDTDLPGASA